MLLHTNVALSGRINDLDNLLRITVKVSERVEVKGNGTLMSSCEGYLNVLNCH